MSLSIASGREAAVSGLGQPRSGYVLCQRQSHLQAIPSHRFPWHWHRSSATLPKGSQFYRELTACPLPTKVAAECCPGLGWVLQRLGHKRLQGTFQFSSWTGEEPPRPGAAGQNTCGPGGPDGVPPQENLKFLSW